MRVVVVVGGFGAGLGATEAGAAISAGWQDVAPDDELVVLPGADDLGAGDLGADGFGADDLGAGGLGAALDGAGLALTTAAVFDWQSLRGSLVTAVAGAAVERGVPCVVVAGQVSVGRREASAIGVDAAYAVDDATDPGTRAVSAAALAVLAKRVAHRWSR